MQINSLTVLKCQNSCTNVVPDFIKWLQLIDNQQYKHDGSFPRPVTNLDRHRPSAAVFFVQLVENQSPREFRTSQVNSHPVHIPRQFHNSDYEIW